MIDEPQGSLERMRREILAAMQEYLHDAEDGESSPYAPSDIERCGAILSEFLAAIAVVKGGDEALVCTRDAVLKLNALNVSCDHGLIETGEREGICDLIGEARAAYGFHDHGEDVTFEWREW